MHSAMAPVPRGNREVAHAPLATLLQSLDESPLELNDGFRLGDLEAERERTERVPVSVGDELLTAEAEGDEASVVRPVGQHRHRS